MAAQKEVVRVWLESNKLTEYFQEFIDKGYDDLQEVIQCQMTYWMSLPLMLV